MTRWRRFCLAVFVSLVRFILGPMSPTCWALAVVFAVLSVRAWEADACWKAVEDAWCGLCLGLLGRVTDVTRREIRPIWREVESSGRPEGRREWPSPL